MKTIEHSLRFITEVDENNTTGAKLLALDKKSQIAMLEGMLKELILPKIEPVIADINAGGSWAILKLAD